MLTLSGKVIEIRPGARPQARRILRVTRGTTPSADAEAYLLSEGDPPRGFPAYISVGREFKEGQVPADAFTVSLPESFAYLQEGDVVACTPSANSVRVLYRRESHHNSLLVTERCDNYCLMCSQPPKAADDDWLVDEMLAAIPLMDKGTRELGFTGGEPTLLGDRLLEVLSSCKRHLPSTAIHVLSNGRRFSDPRFAEAWANLAHPDLVVGIPLYGDVSTLHDYVVQADGAFDETVRGILNLKRLNQRVEVRVVIHQQTYECLPRLAEFLARNLLFVDHVALMGLEIMGFTRANLDMLWIDPVEYQSQLKRAVKILNSYGMRVSIYNHQLCLLDRELWPFAVKSISDWKNEYFTECEGCAVRTQCGGFFSSAKYKRSAHARAVAV